MKELAILLRSLSLKQTFCPMEFDQIEFLMPEIKDTDLEDIVNTYLASKK